jgi:predicted  nucleic acid-binding Zn-ribbon protein
MIRLPPISAFVLLVAVPVVVGAQSLGEVAKRQEEKKKKKSTQPPSKVYTEEDLKKARESGSGTVNVLPEIGSSSSPAASERPSGSEGGPARGENSVNAGPHDESSWRAEAGRRRDAVKVADSRVQMLEAQVAGLRSDMSPTNTQDPNRLQNQDRELRQALDNLEAARRELDTARQSLANLDDEARRAGVPPGWVR